MEVWLVGDERIMLPVTPFYDVGDNQNINTLDLNEVGTISIAGKPGLRTITLESFFPRQVYSFVASTDINTDPYYYHNKIKNWKDNGEVIRLIITETSHNFEVLITDFPVREEDGTGDLYYSISLTEYKRLDEETNEKELSTTERLKIARQVPKTLMTTEEIDQWLDNKTAELLGR